MARERQSEQAGGRDWCPYKVRREVEKKAACGRAAKGNREEICGLSWETERGSNPTEKKKNPTKHLHPEFLTPNHLQPPGKLSLSQEPRFQVSWNEERRKVSSWTWRTLSPNLLWPRVQKAVMQATQNPYSKRQLVAHPVWFPEQKFEFGLSWEESGSNNLLKPLKGAAIDTPSCSR